MSFNPNFKSIDPNSTTSSVPIAAMPLISPQALLEAHLAQTPPTRASGRSTTQAQSIDINVGSLTHCHGSSVVKIGASTIVCGVRAEILPVSEIASFDPETPPTSLANTTSSSISAPSYPSVPTPISMYNLLVPNIELNTGCSPLHPANAAPTAQSQSLIQRLFTLLLTSSLIPSSTLEIVHQPTLTPEETSTLDPDDPAYTPPPSPKIKAFWTLYIDMTCLSYGGENSIFDAAWLAMYAALKETILPAARWDTDQGRVLCNADISQGRKLEVKGMPVPLSFGALNPTTTDSENNNHDSLTTEKEKVLIDMDAFEETCCHETGCVVVDRTGGTTQLVRIEKVGGAGVVDVKAVKDIVKLAEERWDQWKDILHRNRLK